MDIDDSTIGSSDQIQSLDPSFQILRVYSIFPIPLKKPRTYILTISLYSFMCLSSLITGNKKVAMLLFKVVKFDYLVAENNIEYPRLKIALFYEKECAIFNQSGYSH